MAWIKVDQSLIEHRKTFYLAEFLDVDPLQAVGHLVALWIWSIDHCPSGTLPSNIRLIARSARWTGPPENFVAGMIEAGFVDEDVDGTLKIHDWFEYAGALIKEREYNRERIKRIRAKRGRKTP